MDNIASTDLPETDTNCTLDVSLVSEFRVQVPHEYEA